MTIKSPKIWVNKTTDNVVRAKIAAGVRRIFSDLWPGDRVRLPDGRIVTYAFHSTIYRGNNMASVSITCYPLEHGIGWEKDPVKIEKEINCTYLWHAIPVNVSVTERPEYKPNLGSDHRDPWYW